MSEHPEARRRVLVYCASSPLVDPSYFEAARTLGEGLASREWGLVYGGGSAGLMGAIADACLGGGGGVLGFIPHFMEEREWSHRGITDLQVVQDMHERKRRMIESCDGIVALPGGCGTLEELLEAITWRRLELHDKPIVVQNVGGYFDPCIAMLERSIEQNFMPASCGEIWRVAESSEETLDLLGADFGD